MSETAKIFIKRCFEPDPAKRATASELLEEAFISDMGKKKKMSRLNMAGVNPITEFNRSVSAPAERFTRAISIANRLATSPEILDSGMDSGTHMNMWKSYSPRHLPTNSYQQ